MPKRLNKMQQGLNIDGENEKIGVSCLKIKNGCRQAYPQHGDEAINDMKSQADVMRISGFEYMKSAVDKWLLTEYLFFKFEPIITPINNSIKSGGDEERIAAIKLASGMTISLMGTGLEMEIYIRISSRLIDLLQNPLLSYDVRKEIMMFLALLFFVGCHNRENNIPAILNIIYDIFRNILPEKNGKIPIFSKSEIKFYISSIEGICLLLTLASHSKLNEIAPKLLEDFMSVLMSGNKGFLDKVAEAIGLIYEIIRTTNEDFVWEKQDVLLDLLNDQIKDPSKNISKKDKPSIEKTFRDVICTIEKKPFSQTEIRFDPLKQKAKNMFYSSLDDRKNIDILLIDSWTKKVQYKSFSYAVGNGVFVQLASNNYVRELFKVIASKPIDNSDLTTQDPHDQEKQSSNIQRRKIKRFGEFSIHDN